MVKGFKAKLLARNPLDHLQETGAEAVKQSYNLDPKLHPLARAKEYKKAVNAAKLSKIFAAPFVANLPGHTDEVHRLSYHPEYLHIVLSADMNGEVRVWNLNTHNSLLSIPGAHQGPCNGVGYLANHQAFLTCGKDRRVHMWRSPTIDTSMAPRPKVIRSFVGEREFNWISTHHDKAEFATAGQVLQTWDVDRTEPVTQLNWFGKETDSITTCRHSPIEKHLIIATTSESSILLFDCRVQKAVHRLMFKQKSNSACWNPVSASHFAVGNDDWCAYVMDIRSPGRAQHAYSQHVSAVMSVDFSPTGRELVSASLDATICTWGTMPTDSSRPTNVYHTKRMQSISSALWSRDNAYIVTGSKDHNLRLWKAKANVPLKPLKRAEKNALNMNQALIDRFGDLPEIKRIKMQHKLEAKLKAARKKDEKRNEARRRKLHRMQKNGEEVKIPNRRTNMVKSFE